MQKKSDTVNEDTLDIANALSNVRSQITGFETKYARVPGSVQLLAVSKNKPESDIRQAMAHGQKAFGENYVDEAVTKITSINEPSLIWHFIGAIQSRKTAQIAQHFHWAHGIDRLKIATRLAEQRPANLPALNVCLQVNLDNEPSKAGISIDDVPVLAAQCSDLAGIRLRGLMAIPAPREQLADQREPLARLQQCLHNLMPDYPDLDTLSMGMTTDLEAAVAQGSTIVRVGTAIFGARA